MSVELLERIRQTRAKQDIILKPSPYLRDSYTDEYGEDHPVKIRNYQSQGILNLLQMERMVLGDDTGLGKTLEMLSTIGYVWMKEPEYVPIIVTTKSALFQWEDETKKFMQNMEAVTVSGEPFKRHRSYEDFFLNHDPSKKRLLILTYDMIMYDLVEAVIRDKPQKPRPGFNKELKEARQAKKETAEKLGPIKDVYDKHFAQRPYDIVAYLDEFWKDGPSPPFPPGWTDEDSRVLEQFVSAKANANVAAQKVADLNTEAAPPKKVPGIIDYLKEMKFAHPHIKLMLVMDEMHKLKNHRSQFHEKTAAIARECSRTYGMTATPVKNRLMEFFSLFRIIQPTLFPKITPFQDQFCLTKLQPIGGGRQVRIVVGYKNLDQFVNIIEPYYLSRKKHDVAKELPELLSREVDCELTELQEELYDLAETGLLNQSEDPDVSQADLLSSMVMCQQAVNSPQLIADGDGNIYEGPSSKIDTLLELLGEIEDQKVIIFSKFEKMISLIEKKLVEEKIACVRITGKENSAKQRNDARNAFQDVKSGINVILITTAGSESLNLQSAEHFIFMDMPWSWGDYIQLIGRMIRIGSVYKTVIAHHLLGRKRDGSKTIDHHVLKALRAKKKLADKVAGESLKEGLKFTETDTAHDILSEMKKGRDAAVAPVKSTTKTIKVKTKAKPKKELPPDENPVTVVSLDLSDL